MEGMDAGVAEGAVQRLWPGRSALISALAGGITNRNYRVDVDGSSFVLRVGGNDTNLLGIDRAVEHAASLRAASVGAGPEVVAFVEPEGWRLTRSERPRRFAEWQPPCARSTARAPSWAALTRTRWSRCTGARRWPVG